MGKKDKKEKEKSDRPKGQRDPALCAQPQPVSDMFDLWPLVIKDMEDRDRLGRARYGIPLRPQNGRDALVDAYQEVLDLSVYLRQEIEERRILDEAIEAARKVPGFEKVSVGSLDKVITSLLDAASHQRDLNRLLSAKLVDYQSNTQYCTGYLEGVNAVLDYLDERFPGALPQTVVDGVRNTLERKVSEADVNL